MLSEHWPTLAATKNLWDSATPYLRLDALGRQLQRPRLCPGGKFGETTLGVVHLVS
jgi:hypothetical protein